MSNNDNPSLPSDQSSARAMAMPRIDAPRSLSVPEGTGSALAPSPAMILHGLRRHWLLASGIGILCAALIGPGMWFGRGAVYKATSYLRVSAAERKIVFNTADTEGQGVMNAFDIYKATQEQLLKSRFVLIAALRRPEIAKLPSIQREQDPVTWLSKELQVTYPGKAEIMTVSLNGTNAQEITALVRAVVDAYLNEVVDVERNQRRQRLNELDKVYVEKESDVRTRRTDMRRLAEQLGTTDSEVLTIKQQNAVQQFAEYQKELVRLQFQLMHSRGQLKAQQAYLTSVDEMKIPEYEVAKLAQYDPAAKQLMDQISLMRLQEKHYKNTVKADSKSSYVSRITTDLEATQHQYEELERDLREKVRGLKRSEIEGEIRRLESDVAIFTDQERRFQEDVERQRKDVELIGGRSIDIEMARAEINQLTKVLSGIAEERERLKVEMRSASRITLLQSAEVPQIEEGFPIRVALTALAMLLGLCLPGAALVYWDVRADRINTASEVAKGLGLPVVGSIPLIPARIIRRLGQPSKQHNRWRTRLAEAVDGVAARLLRRAELDGARLLLISSATSGEGKTTLASQLAMSFARNGRRTLLVDFDLRRPVLNGVFGVPLEPGVSEVLRDGDSQQVCHATATDNLWVMTAGSCDRRSLAALANGAAGSLLARLREQFDLVVVDSSPILPVADTRFVSQYADAVVLAVFRDVSQSPKIVAACEILEAFGVRTIEAVVTAPNEHLGGKVQQYESAVPA